MAILNRRRVRSLCGPLARHPLAPGCIQMSFVHGTPLGATDVEGWWRYPPAVGTRAERRAARERVAAYHEARLGELVESIAATIDRYRAGEIDAYTVDETIHHYHGRSASCGNSAGPAAVEHTLR
jgi:hypothetical protein